MHMRGKKRKLVSSLAFILAVVMTTMYMPLKAFAAVSYLDQGDAGWFETTRNVPAEWADKVVYLRMGGLQCDAIVWVNNQRIGEILGPEGRLDITSAVTAGQDAVIRLWVTNYWENTDNRREDDPFRNYTMAERTRNNYAGNEEALMKNMPVGVDAIWLEATPAAAEIENILVAPNFRGKSLDLYINYMPRNISGAKFSVRVTELDGATVNAVYGGELPYAEFDIADQEPSHGIRTQKVSVPWANPRLWEVLDAYLYYVEVKLIDAQGQPIHSMAPIRFGFREIWTEGKELMLNGHPLKLRTASFVFGVPELIFYEGMGFNALEVQPNYGYWFGESVFPADGAVMQTGSKELLDATDERGWVVMMPAPSINALLNNRVGQTGGATGPVTGAEAAQAKKRFAEYFVMWSRIWDRQNRASILMWCPSMNARGAYGSDPQDAGMVSGRPSQPTWLSEIIPVIKDIDPTRLVFNHDGANTGDIHMANLYPNFTPLQEREDWLSNWSVNGEAPFGSVEYGYLMSENFFKPSVVPLYTEYSAIYLGDNAYAAETEKYVDNSLDITMNASQSMYAAGTYGAEKGYMASNLTESGYGEMLDLFIRSTNKSWRAYGLNGGLVPWTFDIGFGYSPYPGGGPKQMATYTELEQLPKDQWESLKNEPDWANLLYRAFKDTMSSRLVFLGGPADDFTSKDHNFYSGAEVTKSIVSIWDGPGDAAFSVDWTATVKNGELLGSGALSFAMAPGTVDMKNFAFNGPIVSEKTIVEIAISIDGNVIDSFEAAFFPAIPGADVDTVNWGIYDPSGKTTALLAELGVTGLREVELGDPVGDLDVLIVGYKAMSENDALPYNSADVEKGLKVVVFEQELLSLQALGFRAVDAVSRYTYPRVKDSSILAGIEDEDLINWRGSGQLLPESLSGDKRGTSWPHAPHWGNKGSVSSVVIETPTKGAFTPLIECEFDLAYSPLLEWKHGEGEIIYCQLDLTDRIGDEDPVAIKITANLINYMDNAASGSQNKTIRYYGTDEEDEAFLKGLEFELAAADLGALTVNGDILVVGHNALGNLSGADIAAIKTYVDDGGAAVVLPQNQASYTAATGNGLGYTAVLNAGTVTKIDPDDIDADPILRGIGPQLLHWRHHLNVETFSSLTGGGASMLDGLMYKVENGSGGGFWLFSQLDWRALNQTNDRAALNLRTTQGNMERFYSSLFTNLGAISNIAIANQLFSGRTAQFVNIGEWMVAQKTYEVKSGNVDPANPTTAIQPDLGNEMDVEPWLSNPVGAAPASFEKAVMNDPDIDSQAGIPEDFLSLAKAAGDSGDGKAGIAVTYIYSSKERDATVSMSADWYFILKVNGEVVIDQSKPGQGRVLGAAKPGEVIQTIHLEEGWNQLVMKIGSGSQGFGFYFQMTDPGDLRVSAVTPENAPDTPPGGIPDPGDLLPEPTSKIDFYKNPFVSETDPYRYVHW